MVIDGEKAIDAESEARIQASDHEDTCDAGNTDVNRVTEEYT
jgi:hypothetical protein